MKLTEFLQRAVADQAARTRSVRHGDGVLTLSDGVPVRARGCRLPDGTVTEADCLPSPVGADDASRVWIRRLNGTAVRRRGRLVVEPGVALRFVDEQDADLRNGCQRTPAPNLERDLAASHRIRALARSPVFATLLYGALCDTVWRHATGAVWLCGWRHAGGIVATLRGEGSYVDWYCSGGEGLVDEQVMTELNALGWQLVESDSRAMAQDA